MDGWERRAIVRRKKNAHYYKSNKGEQKNRKEKGDETSKRVKGAFRSCFVFVVLLPPCSGFLFWFAPLTSRERNKPLPPSMSFIAISFRSQLHREGQFKVYNGWRVKSTKKKSKSWSLFFDWYRTALSLSICTIECYFTSNPRGQNKSTLVSESSIPLSLLLSQK